MDGVAATLTEALDRVTDAFVILDRSWRFTYLNQRAADLLRKPIAELTGQNVWEVFPASVGTKLHQQCLRAMAEQTTVAYETCDPTQGRWFETRLFPGEQGLAIYACDITDRKRDRLKLQAEHAAL